MVRARVFVGALAWIWLGGLGKANGDVFPLLTAHGSIERVGESALTLKPQGSDGKYVKNLVLKLTDTSRLTTLTVHKRAGRVVIIQTELRPEDLKPRQSVAVIYTTSSAANFLVTAVVQPGLERDGATTLPPGVPSKVATVLKHIDEHKAAPPGYEGGGTFLNLGRDGEQVLPRRDGQGKAITYHEWDVNSRVPGKNRGPERLVTGSDGSAFYTKDHYQSYIKIR
jgi:guanyl-specific ribonuclease Sa